MHVLSLFDGMSCGQIALSRAGVKVDKYFASEIDAHAMRVTQAQFPYTIQLGSVTDLTGTDALGIDLLIGGSPCQSFSTAGLREGFSGKSKLFFEFVRILKECKPKFFLLENVVMKKEWEQVITDTLGVSPVKINSNLVSAQNRNRLYWTDIPMTKLPADKGVKLRSILVNFNFGRAPYREAYRSNAPVNYKADKFIPLMARGGGRTRGIGICDDAGNWRKLTPIECERLQTVPDNYTAAASDAQRYKMLGNGWTVDVIAHLFKPLALLSEL